MEIRPGNFADPQVKALLKLHLEGMLANSPPGLVFALDWSGLQVAEISFYTGWEGESLMVIGAMKELGDKGGEIKSMRVSPAHQGQGHGEAMLQHIMAEARRRKMVRLSLETGTGTAFEPALRLYRKHGFQSGGVFGDYEKSSFNQFFHLDLNTAPHR